MPGPPVEPDAASGPASLDEGLERMGFQPAPRRPVPGPTPGRTSPRPGSGSVTAAPPLTADRVLRHGAEPPPPGWRRAVFAATFGAVRPGPSRAEQHAAALAARATRPVPGCWRVAVLSLKGGVGKTTTTVALGATLATLRGDRVVAVDANPDRGTLGERVPHPGSAGVRDLLAQREALERYSDVRAFTSLDRSRLEVLAGASDPRASQAFGEEDYRATVAVLERFYSLILTDCGTGLLHSAMAGVLGLADAVVLVASPSLDGARSASATLDWLEAHGHGDLVRGGVTVLSAVRPRGGAVDVAAVEEHFAHRCRAVVRVPFDPHLEAGSAIALDRLRPGTREAYLRLAAAVGDALPG